MTAIKTLKSFIAQSNIDESLIRATVRQAGGWSSFKEMASDVSNHGAAGGFDGFIYYTDTVKFFNNKRDEIVSFAKQEAQNFGVSGAMALVSGINQLYATEEDVSLTLYGPKRDVDMQVANACSWWVLESVCRSYCDLKEQE